MATKHKGVKGIPPARHEISEEVTMIFTPYEDMLKDAEDMPDSHRRICRKALEDAFAEALKERYLEYFRDMLRLAATPIK